MLHALAHQFIVTRATSSVEPCRLSSGRATLHAAERCPFNHPLLVNVHYHMRLANPTVSGMLIRIAHRHVVTKKK